MFYLEDVQLNHSSRTINPLLAHLRKKDLELWLIPLHDAPLAEEPHDPGRGAETAEHDCHAAILVDVSYGLGPGPRGIDVGRRIGREDGECGRGEAFGRYVDMLAG